MAVPGQRRTTNPRWELVKWLLPASLAHASAELEPTQFNFNGANSVRESNVLVHGSGRPKGLRSSG